MKYTPELHALAVMATVTLLMWVPYILARVITRGMMGAFANPDPSLPPEPAWAQRMKAAHTNTVENLVVFAPLVLVAALAGVSTPATVAAAWTFVAARLAYYLIYAAGIPVARTLAFLVGVAATAVIAVAVLGAA